MILALGIACWLSTHQRQKHFILRFLLGVNAYSSLANRVAKRVRKLKSALFPSQLTR
jgi:hypothetical protein